MKNIHELLKMIIYSWKTKSFRISTNKFEVHWDTTNVISQQTLLRLPSNTSKHRLTQNSGSGSPQLTEFSRFSKQFSQTIFAWLEFHNQTFQFKNAFIFNLFQILQAARKTHYYITEFTFILQPCGCFERQEIESNSVTVVRRSMHAVQKYTSRTRMREPIPSQFRMNMYVFFS